MAYLKTKGLACLTLRDAERIYRRIPEAPAESDDDSRLSTLGWFLHALEYPYEPLLAFFRTHLTDAARLMGQKEAGHADDEIVPPADIRWRRDSTIVYLIMLAGAFIASLSLIGGFAADDRLNIGLLGGALLLLGTAAIASRRHTILAAAGEWIDIAIIIVGCLLVWRGTPPTAGIALILSIAGMVIVFLGGGRLTRGEFPYIAAFGAEYPDIIERKWPKMPSLAASICAPQNLLGRPKHSPGRFFSRALYFRSMIRFSEDRKRMVLRVRFHVPEFESRSLSRARRKMIDHSLI